MSTSLNLLLYRSYCRLRSISLLACTRMSWNPVPCAPLTKLFSQSSIEWKQAPVLKKGSRHKVANYRPISLTSIVVNWDSRIGYTHRTIKFSTLKMCHQQHGFICKKSCFTNSNLLATFEDWTSTLDQGYGVDVIYLDYNKAFDSVPHQRLLCKLEAYGIRGNLLSWLSNFVFRE